MMERHMCLWAYFVLLCAVSCLSPVARAQSHPHLSPASIGFLGLPWEDHQVYENLRVEGSIPTWLNGSIYRNTPARYPEQPFNSSHWFMGLAMVHAFHFGSTPEHGVVYTNQFVKSDVYKAAYLDAWEGGSSNTREGAPPHPSAVDEFQRGVGETVYTPLQHMKPSGRIPRSSEAGSFVQDDGSFSGNSQVTIRRINGSFLSNTGVWSNAFDPSSLDTIEAPFQYHQDARSAAALDPWSAPEHAHTDLDGTVYHYVYNFDKLVYQMYTVPPYSRQRIAAEHVIPVNPAIRMPLYQHSFALTENYLVISETPCTFGNGWNEFRFFSSVDVVWHVVDKRTGAQVMNFTSDPFFMMHHVNAYESTASNSIVVDLVTYPDVELLSALYLDSILFNQTKVASAIASARLQRFMLPLDKPGSHIPSGTTIASFTGLEFPTINYAAYNTQPYNFVYAAGMTTPDAPMWNKLVKIDISANDVVGEWTEPHCYPGEPVFAGKPGSDVEDDGVLLAVVLNSFTQSSFLLVLDAATFTERARVPVPHNHIIPLGFHGRYYDNATPWS